MFKDREGFMCLDFSGACHEGMRRERCFGGPLMRSNHPVRQIKTVASQPLELVF